MFRSITALTLLLAASPLAFAEDAASSRAAPPLSPAQQALFDTPHLKNVTHPATLEYAFQRIGPDGFSDSVHEHIVNIHPDGTKYVSFDFLTGKHYQFYPAVDDFSGNPILMLFLENDTKEMRDQIGIAAAYFRDRMRDAFVDRAAIAKTSFTLNGRQIQARQITLQPFATDRRFEKIPQLQQKTYRFILSDEVPGQIVELSAAMPANPAQNAPAWAERFTFKGETP